MRTWKILTALAIASCGIFLTAFVFNFKTDKKVITQVTKPQKGCVFRTIFEKNEDTLLKFSTPEKVQQAGVQQFRKFNRFKVK